VASKTVYGLPWSEGEDLLAIELAMIAAGGFIERYGRKHGQGVFHHQRAAQSLCWPNDDHHRWSDLSLRTICEERITVLQGTKDSSKTRTISKWGLIDYWASPSDTLTLVSSTGIRELKLRIWGDITSLFKEAKDRYPWLAGRMSNTMTGIFTDLLEDTGDVRDIRRGMIAVPCVGGEGEWIGMDRYVGIKQRRRRILGDELQFMAPMYVNVLDAMDKGDFKGVFAGNPIGGNGKALDKIAEPLAGWSSLGEITKTTTWRNKYDGVTVQLVGSDSPNFDKDRPKYYPYLTDEADLKKIEQRNGKDSAQYWTLGLGVRKIGADAYRVLTVEMCERCGAFKDVIWRGGERTRVYAIDAGFGGDPCEVMDLEFGEDVEGRQVIRFNETRSIPIEVSSRITAEDQIAYFVKADAERLKVPPQNIFFDAGMRATLAISMARVCGNAVNAVNFGGPATDRPVDDGSFIDDPKTGERRLMKCNELYSKFVTEMWYSIRKAVECKQARNFPKSAAEEFSQREWRWVPGPLGERYELETKPEYKLRNSGHSPNKADVLSIGGEGARRLGFVIQSVKEGAAVEEDNWLEREQEKWRKVVKKSELKYG
jgi:hypothetical protein